MAGREEVAEEEEQQTEAPPPSFRPTMAGDADDQQGTKAASLPDAITTVSTNGAGDTKLEDVGEPKARKACSQCLCDALSLPPAWATMKRTERACGRPACAAVATAPMMLTLPSQSTAASRR